MAFKSKDQAKAYYKAYKEANKEKEAARIKAWKNDNKEHIALQAKEYYKINKETIAAQKKEYYLKNKDIIKSKNIAYNSANRQSVSKKEAEWRANNQGRVASNIRKYQASKICRTPVWLTDFDKLKMQCVYSVAAMLTRENKESWEVDHIIPLQGKLVSGLHVPSNLQVIKASSNRIKNNKYEVTHA